MSAAAAVHCDWITRLADLDVGPDLLTVRERAALDEHGFTYLHDLVDAAWLAAARQRYEELVVIEGADLVAADSYRTEQHREVGARRLPDLVNKGAMFDRAWLHPRVLAVVAYLIARPFKLSALSGRDALRGHGHQWLHADWGPRQPAEPVHVVNCIWALDGFTATNGAPRLVPGSQRWPDSPAAVMTDSTAMHPQQIQAGCPPGSVVAMNAHTWHGGMANQDGTPRRSLHAYFCARQHGQQLDQREYLRQRTWQRLAPAARWLLDVD